MSNNTWKGAAVKTTCIKSLSTISTSPVPAIPEAPEALEAIEAVKSYHSISSPALFETIAPSKLSFRNPINLTYDAAAAMDVFTYSRVAEYFFKLSRSINYASVVRNLYKKLDIGDIDSPFIDTRKQEVFDWKKNTNAYQRILHLSDLEDKWDGYSAPKFSKEQIDLALTLYSSLVTYAYEKGIAFAKIEPFIAPSSDGTILFEWAGKRFPSRQLEIYVPASPVDALEYLKTEGEYEDEGEFHFDVVGTEQLYFILDWLFKLDY